MAVESIRSSIVRGIEEVRLISSGCGLSMRALARVTLRRLTKLPRENSLSHPGSVALSAEFLAAPPQATRNRRGSLAEKVFLAIDRRFFYELVRKFVGTIAENKARWCC